jgi:hypothetical protein
MAQARKMEAAGRRDEALNLYRAALTAIRQADAARKIAPPARRRVAGMVITARGKPDAQSASLELRHAGRAPRRRRVGAGATATRRRGRTRPTTGCAAPVSWKPRASARRRCRPIARRRQVCAASACAAALQRLAWP